MINTGTIKMNSLSQALIYVCTFLLGITINQTSYLFGINSSLSDILLILIIPTLIYTKQLNFVKNETIFFLMLSILVLFSATFVVPTIVNITPSVTNIFSDYIKILVSFLYFILGYNLSRIGFDNKVIRVQAKFAVLVAILGIVANFIPLPFISETFFFGGYRLKGFLNDPNLFAIVQILALSYFLKYRDKNNKFRGVSIFLLIFSILMSGSKTGLLSMIFILCLDLFQKNFTYRIKLKETIVFLILAFILIILAPPLINYMLKLLISLAEQYPSIERLSSLFTDFSTAISGDGSHRDVVWKKAIKIISMFPITGVGVGTYLNIAGTLPGVVTVAHNTYLQMYAEWGIIFASIFFLYIIYMIFYSLLLVRKNITINVVSSGIIAIMIGSLSISLNNARFFWLYLGILLYHIKFEKNQKI
ncbi:O-antigen ligase [Aerococcus sp. 1KP-2016]|uniref:O-antigen ligase family protein n=1 Tax=Aerococcus sp. 1KP-2016 TaxID=1981982 RepID=UPI001314BBA5|nr:O-antigen ligase family protein [Aerococcus sp. 1KP-2016]